MRKFIERIDSLSSSELNRDELRNLVAMHGTSVQALEVISAEGYLPFGIDSTVKRGKYFHIVPYVDSFSSHRNTWINQYGLDESFFEHITPLHIVDGYAKMNAFRFFVHKSLKIAPDDMLLLDLCDLENLEDPIYTEFFQDIEKLYSLAEKGNFSKSYSKKILSNAWLRCGITIYLNERIFEKNPAPDPESPETCYMVQMEKIPIDYIMHISFNGYFDKSDWECFKKGKDYWLM